MQNTNSLNNFIIEINSQYWKELFENEDFELQTFVSNSRFIDIFTIAEEVSHFDDINSSLLQGVDIKMDNGNIAIKHFQDEGTMFEIKYYHKSGIDIIVEDYVSFYQLDKTIEQFFAYLCKQCNDIDSKISKFI